MCSLLSALSHTYGAQAPGSLLITITYKHTLSSHVSRIIYTFEKLNKYWCRHFKLQRKQQQQDGKKENNCRLINEKALMWLCMIFQFVAIVAQFVPLTSSTHGAQWRKSVWVNVNVSECAFVFFTCILVIKYFNVSFPTFSIRVFFLRSSSLFV